MRTKLVNPKVFSLYSNYTNLVKDSGSLFSSANYTYEFQIHSDDFDDLGRVNLVGI